MRAIINGSTVSARLTRQPTARLNAIGDIPSLQLQEPPLTFPALQDSQTPMPPQVPLPPPPAATPLVHSPPPAPRPSQLQLANSPHGTPTATQGSGVQPSGGFGMAWQNARPPTPTPAAPAAGATFTNITNAIKERMSGGHRDDQMDDNGSGVDEKKQQDPEDKDKGEGQKPRQRISGKAGKGEKKSAPKRSGGTAATKTVLKKPARYRSKNGSASKDSRPEHADDSLAFKDPARFFQAPLLGASHYLHRPRPQAIPCEGRTRTP